jgi:hypothetical protein
VTRSTKTLSKYKMIDSKCIWYFTNQPIG